MTDAVDRALSIAADLREAEKRVDRNPSDAQKESGTYRKGHLTYKGLNVTIENPKGSERSGVSPNGKRWSVKMPAAYGYVKGTEGHDGDHVDVYLGPDHASNKVYVVDQIDAKTGKYDEHKCLLSFGSKSEALAAYEKAFSDGRAKDRIGAVTEMTFDKFKDWVKSGDTKSPLAMRADGGGVGRWAVPAMAPQPAKPESFTDKARRLLFSPQPYANGGTTRKDTMPLIKGSSRNAVSSNIKTELSAGKPRDQAIAIAMDVARRAKRASGGGVDDDDMPSMPRVMDPTDRILDGEILEPMNSRERARVARKAMYGRDPVLTPEDRAEIAGRMPAYEETARQSERILPELFNVPRTIDTGIKAYKDPSLANVTSFGVNAALTAMRPVAAGVIGATGLAEGLRRDYMPSFLDSAEAQSDDPLTPDQRKRYNRLSRSRDLTEGQREELRSLNEIVRAAGIAKATSGTRTEEDRKMREQSQYDAKVRSALDKSQAALARDKRFADTETGKVFNALGPIAPGVVAAPLGLASRVATGGGSVMKDYVLPATLGTFGGGAAAHWPMAYDANYSPTYNPKRESLEILSTDLPEGHPEQVRSAAILAGPNAPEKRNPVQREAEDLLYDPKKFAERSALGVAEGIGGGLFGADLARWPGRISEGFAALPSRVARTHAEGMVDANEARLRALNAGRDVTESRQALKGASGQQDRQRQLADESLRSADEAAGLEAGAGTGPMGSRPASPEAGPTSAAPMPAQAGPTDGLAERIRRNRELGDRLLADEASANPVGQGAGKKTSKALDNPNPTKRQAPLNKKGHEAITSTTDDLLDRGVLPADFTPTMYLDKMSNVKVAPEAIDRHIGEMRRVQYALEAAGIKDPTPSQIKEAFSILRETGLLPPPKRASGGMVGAESAKEHHSHFQPRKVGRFAGGPVYHDSKPTKPAPMERKAKGVDVDAALNTARKYAHGGAVHAGPVPGKTTGRSDKLPIDVEAGSFVIPADIVSALGDGNSDAGYVHLNKVFGDATPRLARGGAAVPIKISHGEYVVPPETVARIGKGDMDMGHRTLDKFVLGVRKHNINKLSKLPPPAR